MNNTPSTHKRSARLFPRTLNLPFTRHRAHHLRQDHHHPSTQQACIKPPRPLPLQLGEWVAGQQQCHASLSLDLAPQCWLRKTDQLANWLEWHSSTAGLCLDVQSDGAIGFVWQSEWWGNGFTKPAICGSGFLIGGFNRHGSPDAR